MTNIKEIEIKSICDLIQVQKNDANKSWFRGHSNRQWTLLPSAYRKHPLLESQTLNHFRLKAPTLHSSCPNITEYSKWLSLMQHYGLPTRLLDWTESPLIALFFALEESDKKNDLAIWSLNPGKLNQSMTDKEYINFLESKDINDSLAQEAFQYETNKFEQILAVTPTYTNDRLDRQHSQFTIHGTIKPLDEFDDAHKYLRKYIIKMNDINNLKNELSILDIRRSKLFPDLQNLSKELSQIVIIE